MIRILIFGIHPRCPRKLLWLPVRLLAVAENVLNFVYNSLGIIARGIGSLPGYVGYETIRSEDLITYRLQIGIFRVINTNENHTFI